MKKMYPKSINYFIKNIKTIGFSMFFLMIFSSSLRAQGGVDVIVVR